jgi:hypothetical protein
MVYASAGHRVLKTGTNGGPSLHYYSSADAHATVEGAGYFSDGVKRGMKLRDIVIVVNTGGDECTIHEVKTVSGNACTINAATLA